MKPFTVDNHGRSYGKKKRNMKKKIILEEKTESAPRTYFLISPSVKDTFSIELQAPLGDFGGSGEEGLAVKQGGAGAGQGRAT
jgi:hypothetical protein